MSNRIINTKKNIIWSYIDYVITIIFTFASKTIIVRILGSEYLGLSNLFSSILQVLNMAELGFSTAIVYNMYKPIAEGDQDTVCAILSFYRKVYRIVGVVVSALGLLLLPFLPYLIKNGWPKDINIYLLYILYLINTAVSYFMFAYKSALLNAMQRLDLTKIAYSIVNIVQKILQIICLLVFKNYYAFVIIHILGTVSKNILAAAFCNKYFPQYTCKGVLSAKTKKDISIRVKGLLVNKISGMTYTTLDSIILSTYIGLTAVAIYNNYLVIFNAVNSIVVIIRQAMQSSVGNSVAKETVEKNYNDMLIWQFLFSAIAIWATTCMFCLFQPFMRFWMGEKMLLKQVDVMLICSWFMISVVLHAFYLYITANGIWWELRWSCILSTIVNIIMNIVLGKLWGTTGIILSTVIAYLVFGLFWNCIVVFKVYFKKNCKHYLMEQSHFFVCAIITCAISSRLCKMISISGIFGLFLQLVVCSIISIVIFFAFFSKRREYKKVKVFVASVLNK